MYSLLQPGARSRISIRHCTRPPRHSRLMSRISGAIRVGLVCQSSIPASKPLLLSASVLSAVMAMMRCT